MAGAETLTGIVSGERHIDHPTLAKQIRQASGGFIDAGIQPGETVAILLRNDIAFFVATFGAQAAEAYPVPVNWHGKAEDISYILRDCGARLIVIHADLLARIGDGIPEDCRVLVVPTPPEIAEAYSVPPEICNVPRDRVNWDRWLTEQREQPDTALSARGSIIYTSGTTGNPKGVVRAPAEGTARERMYGIVDEIFGVSRDTPVRSIIAGPLYHPAPNFSAMRSAEPGSLVVLQPKFSELALLEMIDRYRITHLNMVPTMFIRLLRIDEDVRSSFDVSSLKRVTHAAAPCPVDVKQRMIEWWGPMIYEFYGGTETGTVTLHGSEEALAKPGTVGKPINNCVVKILAEDGAEQPTGETGEVFARNNNLPDFTYLGLPEKRAEVQRGDLITVGDIGYLDEDGYLFLCDRKRDMVISGGVNIYPAEIENVLLSMPGVKDCAVFGIPDGEFGESVCAHVEPLESGSLEPAEIASWLRQRIPGYKVPRTIKIDFDLPREDSGKIMKRRLRTPYWQASGRSI